LSELRTEDVRLAGPHTPGLLRSPPSAVVFKEPQLDKMARKLNSVIFFYTVPENYGRFCVFSGWHTTCLSREVKIEAQVAKDQLQVGIFTSFTSLYRFLEYD
jgi:hypothetical protein